MCFLNGICTETTNEVYYKEFLFSFIHMYFLMSQLNWSKLIFQLPKYLALIFSLGDHKENGAHFIKNAERYQIPKNICLQKRKITYYT